MAKFIVDANLPYLFNLWQNDEFIHVFDKISNDKNPQPRVMHLRTGNLKIEELYVFLNERWDDIIEISKYHKLTNVYKDRIEGIE